MNLDLISIGRAGYNIVDMLSDIGGIQSIIITSFSLILTIFNHKYFDGYMAQRLYKLQNPEKSEKESPNLFFFPTKVGNARDFIVDALPQRMVCCRKTRHQLGLEKAIQALAKEGDILTLIKSRRYFHMALRYLLPKQVRLDLK